METTHCINEWVTESFNWFVQTADSVSNETEPLRVARKLYNRSALDVFGTIFVSKIAKMSKM